MDIARSIPAPRGYGTERHYCPFCRDSRKKKHEKTLSVTRDDKGIVYFCHHCEESGAFNDEDEFWSKMKMENKFNESQARNIEAVPDKPRYEYKPLTHGSIAFLKSRGISDDVIEKFGIKSTITFISALQKKTECIAFPYRNHAGSVYAAKIRSVEGKGFACDRAPQTLFGLEHVEDDDALVICEGEMDALALHTAGIPAASIPNGAVNKAQAGRGFDGKFSFLAHASERIKSIRKIILALDDDEPGRVTADEIARRVGRDRCWTVTYPKGCKDANDVLVKFGANELRRIFEEAKPWPVAGLYDALHYADQARSIYTGGLHPGQSTGLRAVDDIYTVEPGHLTIVTGHPGSGKSSFVDQIMVNLAKSCGWRSAICSFENTPSYHITRLIQLVAGKPVTDGFMQRMSRQEFEKSLYFVNDNFCFLTNDDGALPTIDDILERLRIAVLRHGIRVAVIDPYNYIAKPKDSSETDWISDMLTRVRSFASANGVHVFFVAHPTKMQPDAEGNLPVPTGYSISGSAAWFAKADNGLTVHRPNRQHSVISEIHCWKARFSWIAKEGKAEVAFKPATGEFVDV